jgi:hypothetical protein
MQDVICPFCQAVLPTQEVVDGWCETCGKRLPSAVLAAAPAPTAAKPFENEDRRVQEAARWLPLWWVGGGVFLLVRNGWPPFLPIFSVGAVIAIAIGIGLWFIERYDQFQPWRKTVHIILLLVLFATLAATIVWDINRLAGR